MLKVIFAATPPLACPGLDALHQLDRQGHIQLCAVLTQADRPAGRKRLLQPSAIKARALELDIQARHILGPEKLDAALCRQVEELEPDLLVVFAYGKIFRPNFLSIFPLGGINLHPSTLPQWRGPSPIEAQLLSGTEQLGLSLQRIAAEMDAGDILEQQLHPLPLAADYFTAAELVSQQGAHLLRTVCEQIARSGSDYLQSARPQQHDQATYCRLIQKEDGRIDWQNSALQISRQCRAYAAWPKAHTWLPWQTETGSEEQQINILQAEEWQPSEPEREALSRYTERKPASPGDLLALHPQAGLLIVCGQGQNQGQSILAVKRLQRQSRNASSAKEFANQLQSRPEKCNDKTRPNLPKWGRPESPDIPTDISRHRFSNIPS
ncbi:methionyl-tRNA formyltransferase [Candidatus Haliotispira prima]|uniref:methionyl-tRNA formyltransferase n=1 Tax=Candidatus Haliotispira prima TaxID=3034016 RepID=A0ABY8MJH0_9SPIO|nr:methionyl-tRNA formyltransferase [Candidatus Haliotispira prima]